MKRIIILLFVTLSLAAISAPTDSVLKTVTLTQEQFDSLTRAAALTAQQKAVAQEAVKEATDQLRSEMESRYNSYITHVELVIGLFGVIVGILFPFLINKGFEKSIKEKIDNHDKEIEKAQNTANTIAQQVQGTANEVNKSLKEIRIIKSQIEEHNRKLQDIDNKIKEVKNSLQYTVQEAIKADFTIGQAEESNQSILYFNQAYNEKDLDKKIELYTKAIELTPRDAEAYNNRGVAYYDKGEFNKAIKDFNKAIELNPKYAEVYSNRGSAYGEQGVFNKAIENYNKAINLKPNHAESYCNRGSAYGKNGDIPRAIKDFDKVIELKPNYAKAYFYRGIAYALIGDSDEAIKNYNKAIELDPNDVGTYNNLANAYLNIGELAQALKYADIAIEKDSQQASIFDTRADIYIAMAEKETDKAKAKEYYQKALDDCDTGLSLNPDEEVRKALEAKKRLCEERLNDLQA